MLPKTTPLPKTSTSQVPIDSSQLWYVPDKRITTKAAAARAIELAKKIHSRRKSEQKLDDQDLFIALHICAYQAKAQTGDPKAVEDQRSSWIGCWGVIREHIIERNLGLVYSVTSRFQSRNLDYDELLSDALVALVRAVARFNPWRGCRFSTYACNVIARSLVRLGRNENKYRRLFPVQHETTFERAHPKTDTQAELYVERLHRTLDLNLGKLTDMESQILARRFPENRAMRSTFKEIGDSIGLSKERVRQIQNVALVKLRKALKADPCLR